MRGMHYTVCSAGLDLRCLSSLLLTRSKQLLGDRALRGDCWVVLYKRSVVDISEGQVQWSSRKASAVTRGVGTHRFLDARTRGAHRQEPGVPRGTPVYWPVVQTFHTYDPTLHHRSPRISRRLLRLRGAA